MFQKCLGAESSIKSDQLPYHRARFWYYRHILTNSVHIIPWAQQWYFGISTIYLAVDYQPPLQKLHSQVLNLPSHHRKLATLRWRKYLEMVHVPKVPQIL